VVGQVGVEGDGVALVELVGEAVADQAQRAGGDGLVAVGLVHGRVVCAAGGADRGRRVLGDLGALGGQRGAQHLV